VGDADGRCLPWRAFDEPLERTHVRRDHRPRLRTLENFFLSSATVALPGSVPVREPAHALFGRGHGYYAGRIKFSAKAGRRASGVWRDQILVWRCRAFPRAYNFALLHGLNWFNLGRHHALSVSFWVFVLRRVRRAQKACPFRPKTMLPTDFRLPPSARGV